MKRCHRYICIGLSVLLLFCALIGCSDPGGFSGVTSPMPSVAETDDVQTSEPPVTPSPAPSPSPAPENSEPPHEHSWINATCSQPKTCSVCGETDGQAAGHNWKDATCSQPKTCSACGETSGLTAGHDFENGYCVSCGKADPDYEQETMVWIPTNGGTKYHSHSGCSNMKNPEQVTQSEAERRGFTPCKRCY